MRAVGSGINGARTNEDGVPSVTGFPPKNGPVAIGAARAEIEREERLFAKRHGRLGKERARQPRLPGLGVSHEEWQNGGEADGDAPGHKNG